MAYLLGNTLFPSNTALELSILYYFPPLLLDIIPYYFELEGINGK